MSRAFDETLVAAGGSLPVWQVLLNLRIDPAMSQRGLAAAVGVSETTLTHHLNAMETAGLVVRRRDPADRRTHTVEVTAAGRAAFDRLRAAAAGFDARLRSGLSGPDVDRLGELLERLADNVGGTAAGPPVTPGR